MGSRIQQTSITLSDSDPMIWVKLREVKPYNQRESVLHTVFIVT